MSTQPIKPAQLPNHGELLNALLDIKRTVQLSRRAVYNTMNVCDLQDHSEESAETLAGAEGALTLTEAAIERLYEQLEAMRNVWPMPIEEVSDGR